MLRILGTWKTHALRIKYVKEIFEKHHVYNTEICKSCNAHMGCEHKRNIDLIITARD